MVFLSLTGDKTLPNKFFEPDNIKFLTSFFEVGDLFSPSFSLSSPSKRTSVQRYQQQQPFGSDKTPMNILSAALAESDHLKMSPSRKFKNSNERNGNSPLQSFNSILDRISPKYERKVSIIC